MEGDCGGAWVEFADPVYGGAAWQSVLPVNEASKAAELLELSAEEAMWLTMPPERGAAAIMPPTDPLIYRFTS